MMRPLFSIIIPTCNRPKELAACLERLAPGAQSFGEECYEVVVTDDGCKSPARELVVSRFPWVRWTSGPKRGPAANRNHGASLAIGDWLVFVDDDCLPSTGWLAAYFRAIQLSQVLEGKTTSADMPPNNPRYEAPINLTGGNLYSCNLCIRKQLYVELAGFDERFRFWCEDMDFRRRIAEAGHTSVFVADAVVDHPCRLRPIGLAMGHRWYGIVDLWSSEGKLLTWWKVVSHVAKIRIGEILRMKPSIANLFLAASFVPELWVVCMSATSWIKSSQKLFELDSLSIQKRVNAVGHQHK